MLAPMVGLPGLHHLPCIYRRCDLAVEGGDVGGWGKAGDRLCWAYKFAVTTPSQRLGVGPLGLFCRRKNPWTHCLHHCLSRSVFCTKLLHLNLQLADNWVRWALNGCCHCYLLYLFRPCDDETCSLGPVVVEWCISPSFIPVFLASPYAAVNFDRLSLSIQRNKQQ